jgi:hypothetical protein
VAGGYGDPSWRKKQMDEALDIGPKKKKKSD